MNMIPDEGKYSLKRYKGIITTLIIAIVVFFALWRLDSVVAVANKYLGYISPVIYGVSIAYVLNPAVVYFERLLGARFMKAKSEKTRAKADRLAKNLSIAIVIALAIAVIVVLCLMIIPSMLESIILCIATSFVKDLLVFLYMRVSGASEMQFAAWIVNYEFLSIIGNGVLVFAVVMLVRIKNDYQRMKALRIRQEEKVRWYTLRSRK